MRRVASSSNSRSFSSMSPAWKVLTAAPARAASAVPWRRVHGAALHPCHGTQDAVQDRAQHLGEELGRAGLTALVLAAATAPGLPRRSQAGAVPEAKAIVARGCLARLPVLACRLTPAGHRLSLAYSRLSS